MLGLVFPKGMGSAPASGAVRRAPAPNSAPSGRTIRLGFTGRNANGEGAVGSARGGRAPRIRLSRTARSSKLSFVVGFCRPRTLTLIAGISLVLVLVSFKALSRTRRRTRTNPTQAALLIV
ncbi:MAG: hypothetical protein DME23_11395 [Verrucomicrobia bacterium]|nr:MAG: hypothetical protein DME23_11395 [Verrucomicrobiota bacterium]